MTDAALRPRYRFSTTKSPEEIREQVKQRLKDEDVNSYGLQQRSASNHIILSFPQKHKHFWSPTLDVNFEPLPDGRFKIRMLMGPEPSIWTMFMFFYTVGGLMAALGFVLGYSKYMLDQESWFFWLIPAGVVLVLILYLAGLSGKSRAEEQMRILKEFFEVVMGEPIFHDEDL